MLKEDEAEAKVDGLCRRPSISSATSYAWRKKFAGMEASDGRKLCGLEARNARLKRIVADQVLDTVPWRVIRQSQNGKPRSCSGQIVDLSISDVSRTPYLDRLGERFGLPQEIVLGRHRARDGSERRWRLR